tara:strand:+ start:177 stop:398 length:222 start_codon:yes stop_codon:yes gene_type:complete
MTLKEIVKNNKVYFSYYRAGHLYYTVTLKNSEKYSFPVPIQDIGEATFLNEDKAIIMMRYIRKALKDSTFVRL